MADQPLRGRKVAILLAAGIQQAEFTEPRKAVTKAGADVDVIGTQTGPARTVNNDLDPGETFTVDKSFNQVSADDYNAVIVPGGTVGADQLRIDPAGVGFIGGCSKPASRPPSSATDRGRSWRPTWSGGRKLDLMAERANRHPQRGRNLGRSGGPGLLVWPQRARDQPQADELPAFCAKVVEEFAEGRHPTPVPGS